MKKYQNKYRIPSTRHPNWDYGSNAYYFVTICTDDKTHYFGGVQDHKMKFSSIGKIANDCWLAIPEHFPFVILHNYVVMPNHVHGIIQIDKSDDVMEGANKFGPQSENLASIIRGFKIGVTKNARIIYPQFKWQARFYDHIIRDKRAFVKISEYIVNNPIKWGIDPFNG
ncbi:MAG: hypothetical protein COB81_10050 [Flavobacteriaceae bacterium]|nr:MAG: hypothetical protein COB81_10050 [Flavobacteriaceae bacterium]